MSSNYVRSESIQSNSVWGIHTLSVGYIVCLTLSVLLLESFVVIPFLFQDSAALYFHMAAFLYCTVNVVWYYYKVSTCNVACDKSVSTSSPRNSTVDDKPPKGACFFCQDCQRNSPARAHHCNLCGKCIDRRDHHCYFIANCIGLANLRYFIVLNIFAGIVTVYSVIINIVYLHKTAIPLSPLNIDGILMFIPVVTFYKWCVGKLALFNFVIVMVTWFTLVQILVSCVCGSFQMRLLWSGQTTYEYSHNIHTYNQGWRHNYQDVCGKYWFVRWLLPLPSMKSFVCTDRSEDTYTVWQDDLPRKVV